VQDVLTAVFHTEVGLGSIAALEQAVSTALEAPVTEVLHSIHSQTHHGGNAPSESGCG